MMEVEVERIWQSKKANNVPLRQVERKERKKNNKLFKHSSDLRYEVRRLEKAKRTFARKGFFFDFNILFEVSRKGFVEQDEERRKREVE